MNPAIHPTNVIYKVQLPEESLPHNVRPYLQLSLNEQIWALAHYINGNDEEHAENSKNIACGALSPGPPAQFEVNCSKMLIGYQRLSSRQLEILKLAVLQAVCSCRCHFVAKKNTFAQVIDYQICHGREITVGYVFDFQYSLFHFSWNQTLSPGQKFGCVFLPRLNTFQSTLPPSWN
ncbi:MAG: hypothetical protein IT292_09280 [Deltaproteobacteria bacterium]|nr:hypothetical protein [Deltaproteobacteria bacterium]